VLAPVINVLPPLGDVVAPVINVLPPLDDVVRPASGPEGPDSTVQAPAGSGPGQYGGGPPLTTPPGLPVSGTSGIVPMLDGAAPGSVSPPASADLELGNGPQHGPAGLDWHESPFDSPFAPISPLSAPAVAETDGGSVSALGSGSPEAPNVPSSSAGAGAGGGSGMASTSLFALLVALTAFAAHLLSRRMKFALPPWRPAAFVAVIERPG
jgi:hypothetical protein